MLGYGKSGHLKKDCRLRRGSGENSKFKSKKFQGNVVESSTMYKNGDVLSALK